MKKNIVVIIAFVFVCYNAAAEDNEALAAYYYEYFPRVLEEQGLEAAETFLLRASDYASVSSDISLELARVQLALSRPHRVILAVLNRALATKRWRYNQEEDCRILKVQMLNTLMRYEEALKEADLLPNSAEKERLRLHALFGMGNNNNFRTAMKKALVLYPSDESIMKILFDYAEKKETPDAEDRLLLDIVIQRILRMENSALLYCAAPYTYDSENMRRLLSSWFAQRNYDVPVEALPVLLNFGVIAEETASDMLFNQSPVMQNGTQQIYIPKKIIINVFSLLRTNPSRDYFLSRLNLFSGCITDDSNNDGMSETYAEYHNGIMIQAGYDIAQEGFLRVLLEFKGDAVERAVYTVMQDTQFKQADVELQEFIFAYDEYPSVRIVDNDSTRYYFVPGDFFWTPAVFEDICTEESLRFPKFDEAAQCSSRTLMSFAQALERPSREFQDAREELRMLNGIVLSATEWLNGKIISRTEYRNGRPFTQRLDSDVDGRMETIRYFVQTGNDLFQIERVQVDWDDDGIFEDG